MEKTKTDPSDILKEENQGKFFPFLELSWKGKTLSVIFFLLKEGDLYSWPSYQPWELQSVFIICSVWTSL